MVDFIKILQTNDYSILGKKATHQDWILIYDEFWKVKNDSFSKLILRKSNELLINETKLTVLKTCFNGLAALSTVEPIGRNFEQKIQLVNIYKDVNKNEVNVFDDFEDILQRVKSSIENLQNRIEKLRSEIKPKEEKVIQNAFDIVAQVVAVLQVPLDIKTISVAEFLSYEKIAKSKIKAHEQK